MTAFDLVIAGGTVIDGSGGAGFRADVGIADGRIAAIDDLGEAQAAIRLDAAGRVVAPGFVDLHSHSDLTLLSDGRARSKVAQGVTTEVNGNCGMGTVPSPADRGGAVREAISPIDPDPAVGWTWRDLEGYAAALAGSIAIGSAQLVGHIPLRIAAAGTDARPLDAAERDRLVAALDACLDAGAVGVSTGLMYPPAMSADRDELVAIARAAARRDALFAVHMRNYSDHLVEAVDEVLDVARASNCRLQVSHLAVAGRRNWGAVSRALEHIDRARAEGVDVGVDIYPYVAGSANLSQLLPEWAQAGGAGPIVARLTDADVRRRIREEWRASLVFGWDEIEVASLEPGLESALGLTVAAVGELWAVDPAEAALDLVRRSENRVQMVAYGRSADDLRAVLTHPLASIGSDGLAMDPDGPSAAGRPHPRSFGCYPRLFGRYVRELGVLGLETAIAMSTARPAARAGLDDRGRIGIGLVGDVVVFDPATIVDRATFQDPVRLPVGIDHVVVGGTPVVVDGTQQDDARPGGLVLTTDRRSR